RLLTKILAVQDSYAQLFLGKHVRGRQPDYPAADNHNVRRSRHEVVIQPTGSVSPLLIHHTQKRLASDKAADVFAIETPGAVAGAGGLAADVRADDHVFHLPERMVVRDGLRIG